MGLELNHWLWRFAVPVKETTWRTFNEEIRMDMIINSNDLCRIPNHRAAVLKKDVQCVLHWPITHTVQPYTGQRRFNSINKTPGDVPAPAENLSVLLRCANCFCDVYFNARV